MPAKGVPNTRAAVRDTMDGKKWREDLRAGLTIAWVLLLVVVAVAVGVKLLGY